jgi:hypothetical protein
MSDMSDADFTEQQQPASEPRVRPGLRGMTAKVLFIFLAVGLVPVLACLVIVWPLADHSREVVESTKSTFAELDKQAASLRSEVERLRKTQTERQAKLALAERELKLRHGREELIAGLLPLVRGKSIEDISGNAKLPKTLTNMKDPFDSLALLDSGSGNVLVSTRKTSDKLAAAFKAKNPPPLTTPGWHIEPIGTTGFLAAFNVSAAEKTGVPANDAPIVSQAKPGSDKTEELDQQISRRITVLVIGLPAFSLCLALFFFFYWRRNLLGPFSDLTRLARQTFENPAAADAETCRVGLLEDLYNSLGRLKESMLRLGELDENSNQRRTEIALLSRVIDRAGRGDLDIRAENSAGELTELTILINRLLDRSEERIEALRRAALQLNDSSTRMVKLGSKLSASLNDEIPAPQADDGVVADILGADFEALSRIALVISKSTNSAVSDSPDSRERPALREQLQAATTSLQILLQKTNFSIETAREIESLRQEAEVVSTNMAIAAETRSWSSLQKLSGSTRSLSTSIVEIHRKLTEQLNQTISTAGKLDTSLREANKGISLLLDSIEGWDDVRDDLRRQAESLLDRLGHMRPAAGSLGSSVRSIGDQLSRCRKVLTSRVDALRGLVDSAAAVCRVSEGIMGLAELSAPIRPVSSGVTRDLALTQKALEKSMQELTELAAGEGIEAFSSDAGLILDKIREYAGLARQKIAAVAEPDETSTESGEEHGA